MTIAASVISANCVTTSGPKSSHIVPNKSTPAIFCCTGSSISANAFIISLKAVFAVSPPCANLLAISSALKPNNSKPCIVVFEPSTARIENSFMASPILSKFHAPESVPCFKIENISSALKPNLSNCTEYSFIVSRNSPEKSNPSCVPVTI